MKTRVLIADTQPLFSEALGVTLSQFEDVQVLEERPTTAIDAVQTIVSEAPDVALIDYWMPDLAGDKATSLILRWAPATKVIVLSWLHGQTHIREVVEAGAVGFLPKSVTTDQVIDAIRRAHAGEALVFGKELSRLAGKIEQRRQRAEKAWQEMILTPRELQVLGLLSLGLTSKEIAKKLFLSIRTVSDHIQNMLKKLGVRSSSQAVALALQKGLLDIGSHHEDS